MDRYAVLVEASQCAQPHCVFSTDVLLARDIIVAEAHVRDSLIRSFEYGYSQSDLFEREFNPNVDDLAAEALYAFVSFHLTSANFIRTNDRSALALDITAAIARIESESRLTRDQVASSLTQWGLSSSQVVFARRVAQRLDSSLRDTWSDICHSGRLLARVASEQLPDLVLDYILERVSTI